MRGCAAALAMLALTGCEGVTDQVVDQLARIGAPSDATGEGIRTLSLLGGDVRVRGPEGYCIDQGASSARRGFAVMAGCALLSEDAAVMPTLDGLITVQFGDDDTASVAGNEDAFAAFLETEQGRSILSAAGSADDVASVSTVPGDGIVMARFEDTGGPAFEGTTVAQWRGFMDVDSRLVTVTVLSFERAALSRGQGQRLLAVTMAELAEANPAAEVVVAEGG